MIKFLKFIFFMSWKLQEWIMNQTIKSHSILKRIKLLLSIIFFISIFIAVVAHKNQMLAASMYIIAFIGLLIIVIDFCGGILGTLTSLTKFLENGIIFTFMFATGLLSIMYQYIDYDRMIFQLYISDDMIAYILFILLITITWSIISCISNAKVAMVANSILTAFVLLILQVIDYIISWIPEYDIIKYLYTIDDKWEAYGYSASVLVRNSYITIFIPIILALAIGTILSCLKGYWVEKYNFGKDINREYKV